MNLSYKKHVLVLLASLLFCLAQGWESIFRSWDKLNDLGDAFINMWILDWNNHALFDSSLSVWDAPQFFPMENTLALSEAMFANLWIYTPFYLVTENPVFSSNMVGIISFILCSYCGYLLIEEITGNFWAGLVGGIIFSFSPYRWAHFSHLQLLPFFWAPLAILFAHRFFKSPQNKHFCGIAAATVFQYYHSIYLGAMLTSGLFILFLIHIFLERTREDRWHYFRNRELRRHILITTLIAGLCLAPLGLPYILIAAKWNIVRSFAENFLFSAEPLSFLYPNSFLNYQWLGNLLKNSIPGGETQVFVGFIPWFLAVVGVLTLKSKTYATGENSEKILRRYLIAALAMGVLMLGPYLKWFGQNTGIPLPYQLLHNIIPGAAAMRAPARFVQLALLFMAILAGFGVKYFFDWSQLKGKAIQSILFFGFGILFFLDYQVQFYPGIKAEEKKDFPAVYQYLAKTNPLVPYLELPVEGKLEYKYPLYQTASWRPTLNGKSGWAPPAYREMASFTRDCPFEICVKFLEAVSVKTILIHLEQYSNIQKKLWQKIDWLQHGFSSSKKIGNTLVLERDSLPELTEKIKIVRAYFSKDDQGLLSLLFFQPLEKNKHWNNLKPEKNAVKITIDSIEEEKIKKTVTEKKLFSPAFALSGAPISVPFTRLGKNLEKIQQINFSGDKILPFKIDANSIIFLDKTNTSQNKNSELQAKILKITGLPEKGIIPPKTSFLLNAKILNAGKAYWLNEEYNKLMKDTNDGSVLLAAEWFPKKDIHSCQRPKSKPVLGIYKSIRDIVAPEEIAKFETSITAPEKEGDYIFWIGMGIVNLAWFHDVGPTQVQCFEFSVKNNP